MWNLNQPASPLDGALHRGGPPITVDGALLLAGPILLQPYWPKSHWLLLSLADTARDQDITKLSWSHHRFEGHTHRHRFPAEPTR